MSVARLSAGAGYQYLVRHTACGDVSRDRATALTSYYVESGYPPGTWWGLGLDGLGPLTGAVALGSVVSEEAMGRVFGAGHDPVTDRPLGRPYPQFKTRSQRVADAVGRLPESLTVEQRGDAVAAIERAEASRRPRTAVAGFDLTFTAPKSASVLWALADPTTQALIGEAHQAAVRDALTLVEARAVFTRVGARSSMQVPTRGMVAALFEHWDTRTGDPNLHTHVVIANRVQGLDGQWRTLDSRALHHAVVAVSEVYDNLLADHLATRLPVTWERRDRGPRRTPAFELHGLPDRLLSEFSQRSAQIDQAMIGAVADFRAARGRGPNGVETSRLRQRLTRQIRPPKTARRLGDLIAWWRDRASALTGVSPQQIVAGIVRHRPTPTASGRTSPGSVTGTVTEVTDAVTVPARHGAVVTDAVTAAADAAAAVTDTVTTVSTAGGVTLSPRQLAALAATTLAGVMERRSTWTRWNVLAEAARATRDFRCASPAERLALHDQVVEAALAASVSLAAPELFTAPAGLVRADGVSVFDRAGEDPWTHPMILEAEARLLDALDDTTAPTAERTTATAAIHADRPIRPGNDSPVRLAADQADAVAAIATSGRRVDVLVGPAGTGKTTTLAALRTAWQAEHGPGTVLGLAPSATAAHELSAALGIGCENTAKWIHESNRPAAIHARERRDSLTDFLTAARAAGSSSGIRRGEAALRALDDRHGKWSMRAGMLVIVDEASLAGTLTLDTLATQAREAGAKLLLVGDHHQLSAVDAGGAFGLLAATPAARELTFLWRFRQRWEADATRRLRHGDPTAADTYQAQRRLHVGGHEEVLDHAYTAWADDVARGEASLLLAADTDTVTRLNQRARHDRITTGQVDTTSEVTAADGIHVGVGDAVLTRRNNRGLLLPDGSHVRNGTRWTVTATHPDGGLTLTTDPAPGEGGSVRLPAAYVREHVELGYAATIHRAQGVTVTHSHVIAAAGMTREALYVAMTRGTTSNHAYLPTDSADPHCQDAAGTMATTDVDGPELLATILATSGREKSATETLRANLDHATSPARLLPIRDALTGLDDDTPLGEQIDPAAARRAVRDIDALLRSRDRPAARFEVGRRNPPVSATVSDELRRRPFGD